MNEDYSRDKFVDLAKTASTISRIQVSTSW